MPVFSNQQQKIINWERKDINSTTQMVVANINHTLISLDLSK